MKKNNGFLLIKGLSLFVKEIVPFLILISLLMFAVKYFLMFNVAIEKHRKLDAEIKNMYILYNNLDRDFFDVFGNYRDRLIDSTYLINNRVIPSKLKYDEDRDIFISSFGGDVEIKNSDKNGFMVTYRDVPMDSSCEKFVSSQERKGWSSIEINGRTFDGNKLDRDFYHSCNIDGYGNVIRFKKEEKVKSDKDLNTEIENINIIYNNLDRDFFDAFGNYRDKLIDSTYLINNRVAPKNLVYNKERGVFINSFGGDIEIKNSDKKGFVVTFSGITTVFECQKIAKSQNGNDWSLIGINGHFFKGSDISDDFGAIGNNFYRFCNDRTNNVIVLEKTVN